MTILRGNRSRYIYPKVSSPLNYVQSSKIMCPLESKRTPKTFKWKKLQNAVHQVHFSKNNKKTIRCYSFVFKHLCSAENSITGLSRPAGREIFLSYLPNWKLTCPTLGVKNWKFTSPKEDLYAHLLFRYILLAQILAQIFPQITKPYEVEMGVEEILIISHQIN